MKKQLLSFVIPVMNEEESLRELLERIKLEISNFQYDLEVIFIDDGSTDSSWQVIQSLHQENPKEVKALQFRRNFGKARALTRGFAMAKGDIVFTMDADLQDDPSEIPHFLHKLRQGYDIVSGWKKVRHDPWHKVLPSRVFNLMLSKMAGVKLHDHNCGFKCYRAEVIKNLELYGEMHRMVPSLASINGYRSTEIVVQHHPRQYGSSKYGVKRFLRGFMDMLTVAFLKNYRERPLHLMGGLSFTAIGLALGFQVLSLLLSKQTSLLASVLSQVSLALLATGGPLFAIGLLSELLVAQGRLNTAENSVSLQLDKALTLESPELKNRLDSDLISAMPPAGAKALVVDDDAAIRSLLKYQLEDMGYQVTTAKTGVEALKAIEKDTELVLLDIMMPDKDGIECLKELKAQSHASEVVMVSACGQVDKAISAMKLGAFDFIQKPFEADALETIVSNAAAAQLQTTH